MIQDLARILSAFSILKFSVTEKEAITKDLAIECYYGKLEVSFQRVIHIINAQTNNNKQNKQTNKQCQLPPPHHLFNKAWRDYGICYLIITHTNISKSLLGITTILTIWWIMLVRLFTESGLAPYLQVCKAKEGTNLLK